MKLIYFLGVVGLALAAPKRQELADKHQAMKDAAAILKADKAAARAQLRADAAAYKAKTALWKKKVSEEHHAERDAAGAWIKNKKETESEAEKLAQYNRKVEQANDKLVRVAQNI